MSTRKRELFVRPYIRADPHETPIVTLSGSINNANAHAHALAHPHPQTMDPFSILVGTAGLLDVSFRVVGYLKQVEESAGRIEAEITALSQEINTLITVNDAVDALWLANHDATLGSPFEEAADTEDLWKRLANLLKECRDTVEKLEALLKDVVGRDGPKVSGKLDGIKKQLRRQSKDKDYADVRLRLSSYQAGIQMLLSAISV
jgi:hypothetical protein